MIDSGQSILTADGFYHISYDEVESTNSTCLEIAKAEQSDNVWVTAKSQLMGRGSRGREWHSLDGNLFASLLLKDPAPNSIVSSLTFVTSLAVSDALNALDNPLLGVSLKWPNDVLVGNKKISGILLENHAINGHQFVIVGIGINVKNHPGVAMYDATSLHNENIEVETEYVFELLMKCMAVRLLQWDKGEGFASIRRDWLEQANSLGKQIVANQTGKKITGIFEGLTNDGRLIIQPENEDKQYLSSADIFF